MSSEQVPTYSGLKKLVATWKRDVAIRKEMLGGFLENFDDSARALWDAALAIEKQPNNNVPYIIASGDFDLETMEQQEMAWANSWVSDSLPYPRVANKPIIVRDKPKAPKALYMGLYSGVDGLLHNFGDLHRRWVPGFSEPNCLAVYEYLDGDLRRLSDDEVLDLRKASGE